MLPSPGRNSAKWNGRDVIVAQDLPITKGVQERMREFDKLEEAEEIRELLRQVVRQPPGDVTFAEDTERAAARVVRRVEYRAGPFVSRGGRDGVQPVD